MRPFAAILVLVAVTGCESSAPKTRVVAGQKLVPVQQVTAQPDGMEAECRATAKAVGYPVPCPRLLPQYASATGSPHDPCGNRYTAWFVRPNCGPARGGVFSSIDWQTTKRVGHLVLVATPKRLDPSAAIAFPARPLPGARTKTVGHSVVAGRRITIVEVGPTSESAFGGHLVFVWWMGSHTYALGFHGTDPGARELDEAVVKTLRFVSP